MTSKILAAACLVLLQGVSVQAQSPATPRSSGAAADCTPTAPSADRNSITTTGKSDEPLGDKLARSDGVLCPPTGVDSEIRTITSDAGATKMPVIPPPGSPGGDPSVRPK